MKTSLYLLMLLSAYLLNAQVGIGTTAPTNLLHIKAVSDPLRIEGVVDESLSNINQVNSPTATSEVLLLDSSGVLKKTRPENLDVEIYVNINEFLRAEPVIIPSTGDFNGNVVFIVPPEFDGFIVESVTYRVVETGDNFTVGLEKNSAGVETDLALSTSTIGGSYFVTVTGGSVSVSTGDAIYVTLSGSNPSSTPRGLSAIVRFVKP